MPDRTIATRIATQTSINQRLVEMGFKYVVHDTSTVSTDLMNNSICEGAITGNISKASILGIVCAMLKSKETVRCSTLGLHILESRDLSQAENERTVCKAEQIHKMTTIFTQKDNLRPF